MQGMGGAPVPCPCGAVALSTVTPGGPDTASAVTAVTRTNAAMSATSRRVAEKCLDQNIEYGLRSGPDGISNSRC